MKITKKFKVESAHIVRNCSSERCSHSIHGHSAKIEIEFSSNQLDNAQMVLDFGLMSKIKEFVDSMDHCYLLCSNEDLEYKYFIKNSCDRWIEMNFNPSAEMLSMFVMNGVNKILQHTKFNNGEKNIECTAVTYHETDTGRATCNQEDLKNLFNNKTFNFSVGVKKDWSSELENIFNDEDITIQNKIIKKQIEL